VTVKGDWAIRVPDLAPGGWAFEYENDLYPASTTRQSSRLRSGSSAWGTMQ